MTLPTLCGEIDPPRPLRTRSGLISITGWCLLKEQALPPAIRLVAGASIIPMSDRHQRPDVAQLLPNEPAASNSGFSIRAPLPAGIVVGRFEARVGDGSWRTFRELTIVSEAPPFAAEVDEPINHGTLYDRVKVGGWALDPHRPVEKLTLRYGHREIDCIINQPRADVPIAYPQSAHATRAGFTSEDFLVAGHGPVRVRARLADGSVVVAPTKVAFSIATDENHGPELDLTATRACLDTSRPPMLPPQPKFSAANGLNLLFILPGSFAANNALHVAALADELASLGATCVVAVARDPQTLGRLEHPHFRGITHEEAAMGVRFPDDRGPDIVHAWTTSENVRLLAKKIRTQYACRLIVHLEDNEQEILALTLGRSRSDLVATEEDELNRLVPQNLSHPHHSRTFLTSADGITVITDGLRALSPKSKPIHTIWPAADGRYFGPRPQPMEFRQALGVEPDTTVLFYHGNVHAANQAEMRELYAAVLALNESGEAVILIRTGLDTIDFLGDLAVRVKPYVIALGQIPHHRHLAPLMALADMFVQPGAPDPFNDCRFPSKLPEFFAIGRPVIIPRTNLGRTVRHGQDAYVVDRADKAGIVCAIRALRADPDLSKHLSAGALAFSREKFSWPRSATALAEFYRTLAPS